MRKQHITWILLSLLLVFLTACLGSSGLDAGTEAPNFGVSFKGKTVSVSSYRGRVVLINFWSSG